MTPAQQNALEVLVERSLEPSEVTAIDPLLAADNRNDVAIASLLSVGRTRPCPVTIRQLMVWAAPAIRGRLEDAKLNVLSPIRSIALAALDLLRQPMEETFDPYLYSSLLDSLQAGGAIMQTEREGLLEIAQTDDPVPVLAVSRALNVAEGRAQL